jgi:hypothetical protein
MRPATFAVGAAVAALCIVSISIAPAAATVRITSDNGGMIGDYVTRYMQVRQSGEQVVIDGMCLSACTMVVGIVPRDRVCATPNAVLGFHAAWRPDDAGRKVTSGVATQALMNIYPAAIRGWIARRGGLTPRMMFLRGRELASIVPPCTDLGTAAVRGVSAPTASRQALRSALRRANIDARQPQ